MEDGIILNGMNEGFLSYGRYPEKFVLISQLEVRQEWGVKKGGTWMTLGLPDGRLGGQGHP